jgi:hypothetical protein
MILPSVPPPGYEVLDELGRGGMGRVLRARQIGFDRVVALKTMLAGDTARFHTEAEAVARLQHPNIVQVFEVGEHQGKPFFSLEFCPGGSLAQKLAGRPLPPREAAALVEALARAMHYAHQQNVIHRDLKPANVLLSFCGGSQNRADGGAAPVSDRPLNEVVPKISDFGLARKLDEAGQTLSGAVFGTPSYMAPEQASGRNKEVGPAADVWALGAILYECLTGRPPFKAATTLDTLQQLMSEVPVPPRKINAKVPRDLETICLKCLQKDPARRYPSARELADDLRRFLKGRPILARPTPAWERAWKWSQRRPALAVALLLVLVAGSGWGGVLWYQHQEKERQRRAAKAKEIKVAYYRTVIRHADGPKGVGPLTPAQASRRSLTCKFTRQGRGVVKVELVNGHDRPHSRQEIGTIIARVGPDQPGRGVRSIDYVYDDSGQLAREVGRDRAGREVWTLQYVTLTRARFIDRKGSLRPGAGSWATDLEVVRNADGLAKEYRFLDAHGQPRPDANGVHGYRYERNEAGLPVAVTCLDRDGKPARNKDGYAKMTIRYDENGNGVQTAFFGPGDKSVLHRDGYARAVVQFDEHGNEVEMDFFTADGKRALHKGGHGRLTARYDDRGNLVEVASFGLDGKPTLNSQGIHKVTIRHDERGNQVERHFFGTNGKPVLSRAGHAGWKARFDSRDNLIEESYLGTDGKPALGKQGIHKVTIRHDERGNQVEVAYFGLDGRRTLHRGARIAGWTARYDERDNRVEVTSFGLDRKPALGKAGHARITRKYDASGNKVEEAYFDQKGRQIGTRCKFGYDANSNLVERSFFGPDDKPNLSAQGFAKIAWKYDARGDWIEKAYFGPGNEPTLSRSGCARVTCKRDRNRRIVEQTQFRYPGQAAPPGLDEFLRKRLKYDARRRVIDIAYFDLAGRPVLHRGGYHALTKKYDARGNPREEASFGLRRQPILDGDGIHKTRFRYGPRGNRIEEAWFGLGGQPVRHRRRGYARAVYTWDPAQRHETDVAFFDDRDRPVQTRVVVIRVFAGSQAARVRVLPEDVLLKFDGQEVRNTVTFPLAVARRAGAKKPGPIPLVLRRGDKTRTLRFAPGALGIMMEDRVLPPSTGKGSPGRRNKASGRHPVPNPARGGGRKPGAQAREALAPPKAPALPPLPRGCVGLG